MEILAHSTSLQVGQFSSNFIHFLLNLSIDHLIHFLENENGTDRADVIVTVFDRPGVPGGPLDISNVHKNGCSLAWNRCSDDGGAAISHYSVEKQDLNTGRWVPAGQTTGAECNLDITDLTPGHEYK